MMSSYPTAVPSELVSYSDCEIKVDNYRRALAMLALSSDIYHNRDLPS
jgi:hypothetical protein